MPARPPTPERRIEEKERTLSPHKAGIRLPMVEPTNTPIQIIVFVLIFNSIVYFVLSSSIGVYRET